MGHKTESGTRRSTDWESLLLALSNLAFDLKTCRYLVHQDWPQANAVPSLPFNFTTCGDLLHEHSQQRATISTRDREEEAETITCGDMVENDGLCSSATQCHAHSLEQLKQRRSGHSKLWSLSQYVINMGNCKWQRPVAATCFPVSNCLFELCTAVTEDFFFLSAWPQWPLMVFSFSFCVTSYCWNHWVFFFSAWPQLPLPLLRLFLSAWPWLPLPLLPLWTYRWIASWII